MYCVTEEWRELFWVTGEGKNCPVEPGMQRNLLENKRVDRILLVYREWRGIYWVTREWRELYWVNRH